MYTISQRSLFNTQDVRDTL